MFRVRPAAVAAAVVAVSALALPFLPASAGAAAGPTAVFTKTSDWGTGYEGRVTITGPVSGWRVQFDLPTSTTISSLWDGAYSRSGTRVTVTNVSWNGTLGAGATASFGFTGAYSGGWQNPTGCTLNGAACGGGTAPPTTTPPTTTPPTTTPPPPTGGGSLASAPYLMPLENSPPDIQTVMSQTGVKTFTLAFILSDGGCGPVWAGGTSIAADTAVASTISRIRAAGGDVMPSVGGYAGLKLGETCTDVNALANAYQAVVDRYALRAIDFDIEATEFESAAAHDRVTKAIKILRDRRPNLRVYITVPVSQSGLTWWGGQLVQAAIRNGTRVDAWTIMPFDFGGGQTGMGQLTVNVAEALHQQLKGYYPGLSDDAVYRMSGISSMNGRTDVGEYVRQADMRTILAYAQSKHLGRFTFWSVNRDRQCATPEPGSTSGSCSSVTQSPWEFTKIVAQYTG